MERILICSDIHSCIENFQLALEKTRPDRILISGDLEGRETEYRYLADMTPIVMVQGNCDHYLAPSLPLVAEFTLEGKHFFMTHGHVFGVGGRKPRLLIQEGMRLGADIVIFGHSHQPLDAVWNGIRFLNPGALRGVPGSGSCSYIVLTLDGKTGMEKVEFQYL